MTGPKIDGAAMDTTQSPTSAQAGPSKSIGPIRCSPAQRITKASASMVALNVSGLIVAGSIVTGCVGTRNYLGPRAVPSIVTPAPGVVAGSLEASSDSQQGTANVSARDVTGMGLSYQSTLPFGMVFLLFADKLMSHLREQKRLNNAARKGQ